MSPPSPENGAETPATAAAAELGLAHRVVRHGPVASAEEAARARGVPLRGLVKTIVVRVAEDDHRFVLVPGDRRISWPRLRAVLGVNRASLPSADEAYDVTGYRRGTITPLGSRTPLPVIADAAVVGPISLGAGAPDVALTLDAADLLKALASSVEVTVADVTEPLGPGEPG